jgi:hypothetical protein
MVLLGYSVVWGKLIYEKNIQLKISCQSPYIKMSLHKKAVLRLESTKISPEPLNIDEKVAKKTHLSEKLTFNQFS